VRIEKLRTEHNVKIEWVHFPLHPDTPAEGRALAGMFGGRDEDRRARHEQMKARMTAEGLPYGERTMTYNSRLAQELGKWADTQPGGDALHDAMFRAYFVEARDISQPAVLLDIAERVGLSLDGAREVLDKRTFKDAVDEDWKLSRQYGVTGVPTFVIGRYGVVGAQPYEALEQLLEKAARPGDAAE
jgi:predicted DsbA family dithiol-disulfide isomerase